LCGATAGRCRFLRIRRTGLVWVRACLPGSSLLVHRAPRIPSVVAFPWPPLLRLPAVWANRRRSLLQHWSFVRFCSRGFPALIQEHVRLTLATLEGSRSGLRHVASWQFLRATCGHPRRSAMLRGRARRNLRCARLCRLYRNRFRGQIFLLQLASATSSQRSVLVAV